MENVKETEKAPEIQKKLEKISPKMKKWRKIEKE